MLPTESGTVYGEPSQVHLWPAATLDQPDRAPHHQGRVRPLRCDDMDGCYVYVLYASGHERFYVDGREEAWDPRAVVGTSHEELYRQAKERIVTAALADRPIPGATFLIGPVSRWGTGRWGSNWFGYPVVPAGQTLPG
ncbi:hypothetical protein QOL99_01705 [Deinococcus sp. MIMF12]|uniref:Uncharacterized protein n=1 Tax=Deinococcus rhizophilus TaxID=3049544 RepID=A0ABT7JCT1_9DEIO|nr:hypothetical protein [Deinococcus rhizophilus]MDL2342856.1 hypothetical protein [Deinococcus rhizophilus]